MAIVKGETINLVAKFYNDDNELADPSTPVTVSVLEPNATTLDVDGDSASKESTGIFKYSYTTSVVGRHKYKFTSSDGAIEQDVFDVGEDRVG